MNVTKTWVLTKPITAFDVRYIVGMGCRVKVEEKDPKEFNIQGQTYRYAPPSFKKIIITSEKEEHDTMLLLRFAPNIYLESTEQVW